MGDPKRELADQRKRKMAVMHLAKVAFEVHMSEKRELRRFFKEPGRRRLTEVTSLASKR